MGFLTDLIKSDATAAAASAALASCVICDARFARRVSGPGRTKKYCSYRCLDKSRALKEAAKRAIEKARSPARCEACGRGFEKKGRATRCLECRAAARSLKSSVLQKLCVVCRSKFTTPQPAQVCCGPSCSALRAAERYKARGKARDWKTINREKRARQGAELRCCGCGKEFSALRPRKYCSRECFSPSCVKRALTRPLVACVVCGVQHAKRSNAGSAVSCCSSTCAGRYKQVRRYMAPRVCSVCATSFCGLPGAWTGSYCSSVCADQAAATERKKSQSLANRRRKLADENTKLAVFDRDGWKCKACHAATPPELRGTTHPRAPNLDHIVPLSRGGVHALENLQCLCASCNSAKGTFTMAEFRRIRRLK